VKIPAKDKDYYLNKIIIKKNKNNLVNGEEVIT
jgi:hypothetical protein